MPNGRDDGARARPGPALGAVLSYRPYHALPDSGGARQCLPKGRHRFLRLNGARSRGFSPRIRIRDAYAAGNLDLQTSATSIARYQDGGLRQSPGVYVQEHVKTRGSSLRRCRPTRNWHDLPTEFDASRPRTRSLVARDVPGYGPPDYYLVTEQGSWSEGQLSSWLKSSFPRTSVLGVVKTIARASDVAGSKCPSRRDSSRSSLAVPASRRLPSRT